MRHIDTTHPRFTRPRRRIGFHWWKEFDHTQPRAIFPERMIVRWHLSFEPFYSGVQVHRIVSIPIARFTPEFAADELRKARREFRERVNFCKREDS